MTVLWRAVFFWFWAETGAVSKRAARVRKENRNMYHLLYLLHDRTDPPRHKFPVSQPLGAGPAARGHLQHKIENLAANLGDGLFAIGDRSGVDVHVVRHAPVHRAVARDLDHRDGGEPDGAAAAGGERQQGTAARRQTGEGHRVVARRIHEHETRGGDAFGKVVDFDQRRGAAFGHRTQRFLEDVAQPTLLVAGRRVIVETAREPIQVFLVDR